MYSGVYVYIIIIIVIVIIIIMLATCQPLVILRVPEECNES